MLLKAFTICLYLLIMVVYSNAHISFRQYCLNDTNPGSITGKGKESAGFLFMGETKSYDPNIDCTVTLKAERNYQLLVSFISLSLRNISFDILNVTFNNDRQHTLLTGQTTCTNESCTSLMFESGQQTGSISFHFQTANVSVAKNLTGFKALYTVFDTADSKTGQCPGVNRFLCQNCHCIAKELACDGHNNCGDGSDESQCNVSELDTTWGIVVIVVAVATTLILVPMFCFLAMNGTKNNIKSVVLPSQPTPLFSTVTNNEGTNLLSSSSGGRYMDSSTVDMQAHGSMDAGASTGGTTKLSYPSYQSDIQAKHVYS